MVYYYGHLIYFPRRIQPTIKLDRTAVAGPLRFRYIVSKNYTTYVRRRELI